MRDHWNNCITHFDNEVESFTADYFADEERICLLLAGAGFDPRSRTIPAALADALGPRLKAFFVREERDTQPGAQLRVLANQNAETLSTLVPNSEIWSLPIFDPVDNAPIGGNRISERLRAAGLDGAVTDIVLDLSALSLGVAFPAARILLDWSEQRPHVNLHLMVASNPELDARIVAEPAARSQAVRGFSGPPLDRELRPAKLWLPQLAPGRRSALERIRLTLVGEQESVYKVCPVLPFPARDPRRADALIEEYGEEIRGDWGVDSRDFMYVSEHNPLDSYRTIDALKHRYDKAMSGSYEPQLILSPVGSKVMAIGAMMAAIRHDLPVHYVEALRYEISDTSQPHEETKMDLVHLWLDGPIYDGYPMKAVGETVAETAN